MYKQWKGILLVYHIVDILKRILKVERNWEVLEIFTKAACTSSRSIVSYNFPHFNSCIFCPSIVFHNKIANMPVLVVNKSCTFVSSSTKAVHCWPFLQLVFFKYITSNCVITNNVSSQLKECVICMFVGTNSQNVSL